jgi:hypothetical protein
MTQVERWVGPDGSVAALNDSDLIVNPATGLTEAVVELSTFHFLLEQAGWIRTDDLHPSQIEDAS